MTTKYQNIAMFAIAAVAVMSLGMTQAYAWSINNGFELEDWVIPSGSGNVTHAREEDQVQRKKRQSCEPV